MADGTGPSGRRAAGGDAEELRWGPAAQIRPGTPSDGRAAWWRKAGARGRLISAVLVLAGVLMLLPVVWVVVESLEPPSEQFLIAAGVVPQPRDAGQLQDPVLGGSVLAQPHQLGGRARSRCRRGRRRQCPGRVRVRATWNFGAARYCS